jgi:cyclopropane-fatty-acyl-phospholipid synthase
MPHILRSLILTERRQARSSIIASLERGIVTGRLEIFDPEIGFRSFGVSQEGENDPHTAVLVVKDTDFWIRILFSYDIGCEYEQSA